MQQSKTKWIAVTAVLSALAYIVMLVGRVPFIPSLPFLKYDPKDVIIAIGGFLYGPMTALVISAVVSAIEMVTVSDTGLIGLLMNVLSSAAFACVAALVYKKEHTLKGAMLGLVAGVLSATAVMLLWNYLITPLYMGYPREAIVKLLIPGFLPFNLIKYGINAALTMLIYKPFSLALKRAGIAPIPTSNGARGETPSVKDGLDSNNAEMQSNAPFSPSVSESEAVATPENALSETQQNSQAKGHLRPRQKISLGVVLVALLVLATCTLLVLVYKGVI